MTAQCVRRPPIALRVTLKNCGHAVSANVFASWAKATAGFRFITQNWRGKPLRSLQTIVQLIGAATASKGLKVRAGLDNNLSPDAKASGGL
jgi:Rhodopirellula transposase DDE domain